MNEQWTRACHDLGNRNISFVLATILETKGSTPRNCESKMVVTADDTFDSIGGGHLEYETTRLARELLSSGESQHRIENFSLGPSLGQCCGGYVKVLFEIFPSTEFNIVVFGGGHVATALHKILRELPCHVRWVDSREAFTAKHEHTVEYVEAPVDVVQHAPNQSDYLIMTHDHSLDYALTEAILKRHGELNDVNFCGLIGSRSKAAKFRKRLAFKGFDANLIGMLTCPIGRTDIPGKRPMEIAVSISSDLLARRAQDQKGVSPDYQTKPIKSATVEQLSASKKRQ
ncbi:MAG: xanthine dehydrogenase accessory protein XdhC [Pseudomonadota bacterium]